MRGVGMPRESANLHSLYTPSSVVHTGFVNTNPHTIEPFKDVLGQSAVKARLEAATARAKSTGQMLNHILLIGQPGIGKATLARGIATAMGVNIVCTSANALKNTTDLARLFWGPNAGLCRGDVLLIEDIDQLDQNLYRCLPQVMHEFTFDWQFDAPVPRTLKVEPPRFTVVATTSREEAVPRELLSCFPMTERLASYTSETSTQSKPNNRPFKMTDWLKEEANGWRTMFKQSPVRAVPALALLIGTLTWPVMLLLTSMFQVHTIIGVVIVTVGFLVMPFYLSRRWENLRTGIVALIFLACIGLFCWYGASLHGNLRTVAFAVFFVPWGIAILIGFFKAMDEASWGEILSVLAVFAIIGLLSDRRRDRF